MVSSIVAGTTLPQDMSDLKMRIKLFKEGLESGAKYRIMNLGADDYDMYFCPALASNFIGCGRSAMVTENRATATSEKFITMNGDHASMYLQIAAKNDVSNDAVTGDSIVKVDPCLNKMLDADAYPNGIQFSVEKAVDPNAETLAWGVPHRFTVPITCHTATSTPTIAFRDPSEIDSQTENPYPNGKSWNLNNLEVVVSGSTIDPDVPIKVLELSGTLIGSDFDGEALAAKALIDPDTRIATAELKFVTGVCQTGNVRVTIANGNAAPAEITKEITCPQHEFLAEGIADGALIEPTDSDIGGARYGDVFMVPMQIRGRDFRLWNGPIALRASTGADETVMSSLKNFSAIPTA